MKIACRHCGKVFSAPDSWLNSAARCPQCNSKVLVQATDAPQETAKGNPKRGATAPERKAAPPKGTTSAPAKTAAPATSKNPQTPQRSAARTPSPPANATPPGGTSPSANPPADESDDDDFFQLAPEVHRPKVEAFLEETVVPDKPAAPSSKASPVAKSAGAPPSTHSKTNARGERKLCPNCGARLPADGVLCTSCGYHTIMKRILQIDVSELAVDETYGFERWLRGQLAEGESFTTLIVAFHAFALLVGIVAASFFPPWGFPTLLVVVLSYGALMLWARASGAFSRWGNSLWDLYLALLRKAGWRNLVPPFRPLEVFRTRDPRFGDEELFALADVEKLQALDLEGTAVTNDGLMRLTGCDRLQYIVLKRTKVTRDGIRRLYAMLPQAAVWR